MVSRYRPIPSSRALVCDILRYDRIVPTFAHDRRIDVSELAAARHEVTPRISWPTLFMKAYALNAKRFPRLRQAWMQYPWPHLYEHPDDVATLVIHRQFEDDDWLFWGQITELATRPLWHIQLDVDRCQTGPVEKVFQRQLWMARQSGLVRRFFWWLTFHSSGKKRCKRLGTFFLSTISGKGAEIQNPPSMLTSAFTYGPLDATGHTRVTVTYDHRLLDGHHIADVLRGLETTLQQEILTELRSTASPRSAA